MEVFDALEERVVSCAKTVDARMIILQGVPGSGKSTMAQRLIKRNPRAVIVSADHYMVNDKGEYKFDSQKLADNHNLCQQAAKSHLESGNVVIVDNCNVSIEHAEAYISMLASSDKFVVLHMKSYSLTEAVAFGARSIHQVPEHAVRRSFNNIKTYIHPNACYITLPQSAA